MCLESPELKSPETLTDHIKLQKCFKVFLKTLCGIKLGSPTTNNKRIENINKICCMEKSIWTCQYASTTYYVIELIAGPFWVAKYINVEI